MINSGILNSVPKIMKSESINFFGGCSENKLIFSFFLSSSLGYYFFFYIQNLSVRSLGLESSIRPQNLTSVIDTKSINVIEEKEC